ncbi:MAG: hypothetical protein A2W99_04165 [Bacteroidetes bacterium GWF2_33_16]|nr:MAG: hypothetical protein A2X00_07380 [Bacteroidetes bacterium GWE2_32_14]OFY02985.1 MAG: hypothetical protein A2W99_04165 [Bacteroidetes bacterium GWF2_33_16]
MLQRIQTVYLLIVTLLMGSMYFYPYAELLAQDNQIYVYNFNGLFLEGGKTIYFLTIPPVILLSIIIVVSLVSILLFKKRILQMRISFINLMLMLGYLGLNYYYIKSFSSQLTGVISYNIIVVFPVVAAILTYLAIRAIGKDEALIRSLDRIR